MKDVRDIMKNPLPGIFVELDEELTTVVHAVLTGPFDTPYEGGFFSFVLHMPDRYPHEPPKCRLQTTGSNTVRFGPNLYRYYHVLLLAFSAVKHVFSVCFGCRSSRFVDAI
jgi:ubiquitin-conjugating enzyme E2 Z